jgi:hypothetical protein
VAQAFYILQSNLLARLSAGGVVDLVDKQRGADELGRLQPGQAAMVPWWRWAQRSTLAGLSIDLATTNHNLLEMHPRSRLYHLAAVRERLSPQGIGFVFEGWGDPSRYPQWTAVKDFAAHGFVLAHNDIRIACFAPGERHAEDAVLRYPLPSGPGKQPEQSSAAGGPGERPREAHPDAEARGSAASFWERALRRLFNKALGADVDARLGAVKSALLAQIGEASARLDRIERAVDQSEPRFAAPDFSSERNSISRAIMSMRAGEKSEARLTMQDYKDCFGLDEIWTEDDRFLAYVYRGTSLAHPWITTLPK